MNRVRLSWCGRAACLGDLEAQLLALVFDDPFLFWDAKLRQLLA
jgi:hypothetical protein